MQSVNWAINTIINRTTTHLASWLANAPSNDSAMNSFALNNDNYVGTTQVLDFYNTGVTYQSSMDKYFSGAFDNGQNFLDLPQTGAGIPSLIEGLTSNLRIELASVQSYVRAMIPVLEDNPVGWAIAAAIFANYAFATLLTMIEQYGFNLLNPLNLAPAWDQSNQILFNPSATHDSKLQAIAWIQASKLANDVLTAIGMQSEIVEIKYDQLALQTARTLNTCIGLFFAISLNTLDGYSLTNLFDAPLGVVLNLIGDTLDAAGSLIDLITESLNYIGQTTINGHSIALINAGINLFILGFGDAILLAKFLSNFFSPKLLERIILTSKFTGDIFKALANAYEFAGSEPHPYWELALLASLALSFFSDVAQYFSMISDPS